MKRVLIKGGIYIIELISIILYMLLVPRHPLEDLFPLIIFLLLWLLIMIITTKSRWFSYIVVNGAFVFVVYFVGMCFIPDLNTMCAYSYTFRANDARTYYLKYNTYTDSFTITKIKGFGHYEERIDVCGNIINKNGRITLVSNQDKLKNDSNFQEDYEFKKAFDSEIYIKNDTLFGFNGETLKLKKVF